MAGAESSVSVKLFVAMNGFPPTGEGIVTVYAGGPPFRGGGGASCKAARGAVVDPRPLRFGQRMRELGMSIRQPPFWRPMEKGRPRCFYLNLCNKSGSGFTYIRGRRRSRHTLAPRVKRIDRILGSTGR